MLSSIIIAAAGLAAGFINGFLGTGGGIVLIFTLAIINKKNPDCDTKDNFATVIACILPMSVISAYMYYNMGKIELDRFWVFALPAIAGGLAGAFLLEKIKAAWLKKLFAAIVIWAGITMIT